MSLQNETFRNTSAEGTTTTITSVQLHRAPGKSERAGWVYMGAMPPQFAGPGSCYAHGGKCVRLCLLLLCARTN